MIQEGVLQRYRPEAVFGLHVFANMPTGMIGYRGGPLMAASDTYRILVKGKQTHGARPWSGVDPIVISSQIVGALQTVVSRQTDITQNPAVVTVGAIKGILLSDAFRVAAFVLKAESIALVVGAAITSPSATANGFEIEFIFIKEPVYFKSP